MQENRNCGCDNGFLGGLFGGDSSFMIILVLVLLCGCGSNKCC